VEIVVVLILPDGRVFGPVAGGLLVIDGTVLDEEMDFTF
jgi:hypothetical protein